MDNSSPFESATLVDLIRRQANERGSAVAVESFPDDPTEPPQVWTYAELYRRSSEVAKKLSQLGERGCRGILLYPHGCDFLAGFWGCLLAGWIPVPSCYPRAGRAIPRLDSIANTCQPSAILSTQATFQAANPNRWSATAARLPQLATDNAPPPSTTASEFTNRSITSSLAEVGFEAEANEIALLQFTSGSTSQPKGVMISHANLLANLESIRQGFGLDYSSNDTLQQHTGVFWLPPFHDMGLIGGLLTPFYVGGRTILLSPQSFLARPVRWLELIDRYRAIVTGAPNFAYQLCVERISGVDSSQLDLSSLQVTFCGAEPIQPRVLEQFSSRFASNGFQPQSFLTCYGLAEATLFVAGSKPQMGPQVLTVSREDLEKGIVTPTSNPPLSELAENARTPHPRSHTDIRTVRLISCGYPAIRTHVAITSPETSQQLAEGTIGEVWVRSPSVATGYWPTNSEHSNELNSETDAKAAPSSFACDLVTKNGVESGFYRTGDLGFLYAGQLFITGRLKDLIILRGRNLYPQDIEETVRSHFTDTQPMVAAFSLDGSTGEGLAIVSETPRTADANTYPEMIRGIRRLVMEIHEVDPRHIILVRPASIPITSSGKVRRRATRQALLAEQIPIRFRWDRADSSIDGDPLPFPRLPQSPRPSDRIAIVDSIQGWIVHWLSLRTGIPVEQIAPEKPWDSHSLDSLAAFELSGDIEDWMAIRLNPITAVENDTPQKLATYLAEEFITSQISPKPKESP